MMYGISVLTLHVVGALGARTGSASARSGCHEELARQMAAEAGFTRFEPLDLDHPVNAFYVVRP